jgi:hypothetical protein
VFHPLSELSDRFLNRQRFRLGRLLGWQSAVLLLRLLLYLELLLRVKLLLRQLDSWWRERRQLELFPFVGGRADHDVGCVFRQSDLGPTLQNFLQS